MSQRVLGVIRVLILDIGKTFIQPGSHPLAAKLDVPDLAEGGEDLLEMLPVHVPGQAPNVNLAGGRGPAPGPALAPGLRPGPIPGLLWRSLDRWLVILGFALLSHGRGGRLLPSLGLVLATLLLLVFLGPVPASGPAGVRAGIAARLRA